MKTDSPSPESNRGSDCVRRLVLPRRETPRSSMLSKHLDTIYRNTDAAIHKGYCARNARKLDAALTNIISAAQAAQGMLRQNV